MAESAAPTIFAGRFRLLRVLGMGAFAKVWLAIDGLTGKQVAIKIVDTRDEFAHEAILSEGVRANFLNHPNIVNVLDSVLVGDSAAVVYEYVEGRMVKELDLLESNHGCGVNALSQGKLRNGRNTKLHAGIDA